jgi:signal peptidase II
VHRVQERRAVSALRHPIPGAAIGRAGIVLGVATVVVVADQVTKTIAVRDLASGPVHVIGPFAFELDYNSGVAFSLFAGVGVPIALLVVAVLGLLLWSARGSPTRLGASALGLIVGGAAGNLADRLFRHTSGAVVDFIHIGVWPTFNLADAAVVCGCVLLGITFLQGERSRAEGRGGHASAEGRGGR